MLYACDPDWWDMHYSEVMTTFSGQRYTKTDVDQSQNASDSYDLNRIPGKNGAGLGVNCLHYGRNSGYQAINLAYLLAAKQIILLGYDMGTAKKTHWFGDHPPELQKKSPYSGWIAEFQTINPQDHGIEIINCTRSTALTCFPHIQLEHAIAN